MIPLLLLAAVGCKAPEVTWLEGAGYGWNGFNHRLSELQFHLEDDAVDVTIVGGTSTTGVVPDLPASCDKSTCNELPAPDTSFAHVRWARTSSRKVRTGVTTVHLVAGPEGATAKGKVTLNKSAKGDVTAFITGVHFDADTPLVGGEDCYTPSFGWVTRLLEVGVEAGKADGKEVPVTVNAAFQSGLTFEDIRQCLDEASPAAQMHFSVDVMAVATENKISDFDVGPFSESYGYNDGSFSQPEQPEPDPASRPLDASGAGMLGWTHLAFTFHEKEGKGRGAYIRTLDFDLDADLGVATGHASNYSPGTQQSGFDYTFEGSGVSIALDDDIERGVIEAMELAVAEDGVIVTHSLPY